MAHDVFISYSSKDRNFANAILTVLEYNRIKCWIDYRDIPVSKTYSGAIIDAIDECRVFLVIYSGNAAASAHVLTEVDQAFSREKDIITFKLDNTKFTKDLEYFLKARQWLDALTPPIEDHLAKLTKAISNLLDKPADNPLIQDSALRTFKKLERRHSGNKGFSWGRAAVILAACICLATALYFILKPDLTFKGADNGAPRAGQASDAATPGAPSFPTVFGNSQQNIANSGYAAFYDGWVFFAGTSADGENNGLYKMKEDGSEKTKLSSDSPIYINVMKDWVYYANAGDSRRIYKMRVDGRSRVKVCDDSVNNMLVTDNGIYYVNAGNGYKLYKIMTDGSNPEVVADGPMSSFFFEDGWIYYLEISETDVSSVYRVKPDGSGKEVVADQIDFPTFTFNVADGWVYFADHTDSDRLYKMSTERKERLKLCFDDIININVTGDTVYYCNNSDGASIYSISVNGDKRLKLSSDSQSLFISVINGWVYYKELDTSSGNEISIGKLYRVKTDGTAKEELAF